MKNAICLKDLFLIVLILILVPTMLNAQQLDKQKKKQKVNYVFDQYVFVTLKNGSEVPAKISSVKSKSQYFVLMIGGNRKGLVNKKHIRAMTPEEIAHLKQRMLLSQKSKEIRGESKSDHRIL